MELRIIERQNKTSHSKSNLKWHNRQKRQTITYP